MASYIYASLIQSNFNWMSLFGVAILKAIALYIVYLVILLKWIA